jgi:hypothetical protein
MPGRLTIALALSATLSILWLISPDSAATDRVKKIPLVEIEVRALAETEPKSRLLMLNAERPARLQFATAWDDVGEVRVGLTGRAEASGSEGARKVRLEALLTLPDGRQIQAVRETVVEDRTTLFFELFRQDDRPFTLAITATISESWEVLHTVSVGPPVRFEVEVFRVEGSARTSLERNMLHTFEDQTVVYEFRRGPDLTDEALTLSLTPVRLIGDLVEINVNIEGRLPTGDEVTVIARNERLVVNRGAISPIEATTGDPPVGYRFQVTALF